MSNVIYGADRTRLAALQAKLAQNSDAELLTVAHTMIASRAVKDEAPRVWAVLNELVNRLEAK